MQDQLYEALSKIEVREAEPPTRRSPLPSLREIDRALILKYDALPAPWPCDHGGSGLHFVPIACSVPDLRGRDLFP